MSDTHAHFGLQWSTRENCLGRILRDSRIHTDIFNMIFGEYIGEGVHRTVFAYAPLPKKWVIKVDTGNRNANIMEEETWAHVQGTKVAKWFAPVRELSDGGRLLIQRRCTPLPKDQYPKKVPEFFTDLKYANWGMLDGQFVCMDYANSLAMTKGLFTGKMQIAKWWE